MVKNKTYSSVSELVRDLCDKEFADDFDRHIAQRKLVKTMSTLRNQRGFSQKEVADKMGCTQGRVSKLENGLDADVKFGDLLLYAEAIGYEVHLSMFAKERRIVDNVKYHVSSIKHLFDKLIDLSKEDSVIMRGARELIYQSLGTVAQIFVGSHKKLLEEFPDAPPTVHIDQLFEDPNTPVETEKETNCVTT